MKVRTITTYKVDGLDFDSLVNAKGYIENQLGVIIDKIQPRLSPKQALLVHDILINNRARLISLLSTEYECESQSWQDDNRSIFEV